MSNKNLIPFKKGQSGNPNGRPKGSKNNRSQKANQDNPRRNICWQDLRDNPRTHRQGSKKKWIRNKHCC